MKNSRVFLFAAAFFLAASALFYKPGRCTLVAVGGAALKGLSEAEIAEVTTESAVRLFGIA